MASWRPPGRPRNVWLNKVQEDANSTAIYAVETSDRQGSWRGTTVHSDYEMMMIRPMSKMEGKTNFSRHLQAVRNQDC